MEATAPEAGPSGRRQQTHLQASSIAKSSDKDVHLLRQRILSCPSWIALDAKCAKTKRSEARPPDTLDKDKDIVARKDTAEPPTVPEWIVNDRPISLYTSTQTAQTESGQCIPPPVCLPPRHSDGAPRSLTEERSVRTRR